MTETTDSANPPGESTQPPAESENLPAAETTSPQPAAETSLPDVNSSLPAIDSTMPADTSLPPVDSSLPSFDSSLPPIDSSVPALPAIDTSLPPLDTTLPAEDSLQLPESHSFLPETSQDDAQSTQPEDSATAPGNSSNGLPQQTDPTYQTSSNGAYQYSQPPGEQQPPQSQAQSQPPQGQPQPQPQPQPQQNDQSQPQQQYQPPQQYQPQQYQQPQYQQQPQQQPQQPVHQSYQPQQQYQQQQSPEMYNNSQAGAPPMNAGTMQNMDHNGTQGQPGHIPQAPIGSPMPSNMPPMPSGGQYMTGYPTNVSQMNMNSNYHLPGDPNKMLSGGRHKKEVKRRTKTGCLTCRKRRIKCDEGHPVCRNCVKSKRDCLGYDPVFRTQSTTPSAIQPAPNNPAPPPPPSLVVAPQQEPGPYPAAPPGYVPAVSQPFAPSLQSESSAPSSTEHNQFDYSANIDPALEGNNNAGNMASVQHATSAPDGGFQAPLNAGASVKQVQIGDLLALRGIPPPPTHPITSLPPGRLEEIQAVFLATYAPAIDRFFETPWFQEKALPHAMANAQLMADYSALIDAFNDRNLEDPNVIARLESFEASVLWSTIALCRHVMNMANGNHGQDFDLLAAAKRLDVIEALLTGDHLETNPLSQFPVRQPAADPPALSVQITQRSLDFWSCVGHFLTLHDNEASSAKEIDDTLARCRTLLDTTENRDVIYSIAIARHLGQRWVDFPHSLPQPLTTNEKDAGAKLYVAQKFLEQQASGSGTTQVSKRICGMAVRSWFVSRE